MSPRTNRLGSMGRSAAELFTADASSKVVGLQVSARLQPIASAFAAVQACLASARSQCRMNQDVGQGGSVGVEASLHLPACLLPL